MFAVCVGYNVGDDFTSHALQSEDRVCWHGGGVISKSHTLQSENGCGLWEGIIVKGVVSKTLDLG